MDDHSQINVLRTVIKMIKQARKLKDELEVVRRENQEREDGGAGYDKLYLSNFDLKTFESTNYY